MFKVSTCGGFHLSPAATTAAAAAGSDPPPCWPLTCCKQEGDVVTNSHTTPPPRPSSLPKSSAVLPMVKQGSSGRVIKRPSSSSAFEYSQHYSHLILLSQVYSQLPWAQTESRAASRAGPSWQQSLGRDRVERVRKQTVLQPQVKKNHPLLLTDCTRLDDKVISWLCPLAPS
jgi:hypothetical protein